MVIGEAAKQISEHVQSRFPQIPWAKMKGMRNVVVHEYFRVDLKILWQTITCDLPGLIPTLREIAKEPCSDAERPR
jgi:uncharacterized protein with HEPN domain